MIGKRVFVALSVLSVALGIAFAVSAPAMAEKVPLPSEQSAASTSCEKSVLGIPPWYKGLMTINKDGDCEIKPVGENTGQTKITTFIWTIALNVIQALLVIVAYVTIFFIIKGGFNYMMSRGDSSNMASAKTTIQNAIIGLIIALLSASIVNAIAGAIK